MSKKNQLITNSLALPSAVASDFPRFEVGAWGAIKYETENLEVEVADKSYTYLFSMIHTKDENYTMLHIGTPFGIIFNRHMPMKISKLKLPQDLTDDLVLSIDSLRNQIVAAYKQNSTLDLIKVTPRDLRIRDPSSGLSIVATAKGEATIRTGKSVVMRLSPSMITVEDPDGPTFGVDTSGLQSNLVNFSAFLAREVKFWIARLITH